MAVMVGNIWLDGCATRDLVNHYSGACNETVIAGYAGGPDVGLLSTHAGNHPVSQAGGKGPLADGVALIVFKSFANQLLSFFHFHGAALCDDGQLFLCAGAALVSLNR